MSDQASNPADLAAAEVRRLRAELDAEREKSRAWRSAYHSLRMSLEGRLDRIEQLLQETEWEDEK